MNVRKAAEEGLDSGEYAKDKGQHINFNSSPACMSVDEEQFPPGEK